MVGHPCGSGLPPARHRQSRHRGGATDDRRARRLRLPPPERLTNTMQSRALMAPVRFRFTEPDDVKAYGDNWYVYDESRIVRLPARELIKLETEVGQPMANVLEGFREDAVSGRLPATWIAVHLQDPSIAGPYRDYSPVVMLLDFDKGEDRVGRSEEHTS